MSDHLTNSSYFTVYLEGHDAHQGNVLAHAFLAKVHRLTLVLNKMERAYIGSGVRQTDFEITRAEKHNPTSLTLKPVPRVHAYDPRPAFDWALTQIAAVGRGERPDQRIRSDIAKDLVKLATKDTEDGYKAFWINGQREAVRFDESYLFKASLLAREISKIEEPATAWHVGVARGTVVGELKAVDDIDDEREFVIVPPTGADAITCVFPDSLREKMGQYLFQTVRVEGLLHYGANSPFPFRVEADLEGIGRYPTTLRRKTLDDLRGAFSGYRRPEIDWTDIVNV